LNEKIYISIITVGIYSLHIITTYTDVEHNRYTLLYSKPIELC